MANHKRRKPKSSRAGCLLCKPHKANGCHHDAPRVLKQKASIEEQVEDLFDRVTDDLWL